MYTCVDIYVCGQIGVYVCGQIGVYACGQIGVYVCGHICMWTDRCIGLYICGQIGICRYMHTCTCNTYIHYICIQTRLHDCRMVNFISSFPFNSNTSLKGAAIQ